MSLVAVADTNGLYRLLDPKLTGHQEHKKALGATSHLIISPMVLAELDYLISARAGAQKALIAARFIERNVATRRFEVPSVSTHRVRRSRSPRATRTPTAAKALASPTP